MPRKNKYSYLLELLNYFEERPHDALTHAQVAEVLGLKQSAYTYSLIEWCVSRQLLIPHQYRQSTGRSITQYALDDSPKGVSRYNHFTTVLQTHLDSLQALEDWNRGP